VPKERVCTKTSSRLTESSSEPFARIGRIAQLSADGYEQWSLSPILSFKKGRKIPRAVYDTNDFEFLLSRWAIENQVVRKIVKTHHTEVVESGVVETTMGAHFRSMKQKLKGI
jgi:hypothetical protein